MQFEEIVQKLGGFGRYQRRMYFLLCLIAIPNAWHAIGSVFLAATTDHWCSVPSVPGFNCTDLDIECLEAKKNLTIPYDNSEKAYYQCSRYNDSDIDLDVNVYSVALNDNDTGVTLQKRTVGCDNGWEYDHSQFKSTTVQTVSKTKALWYNYNIQDMFLAFNCKILA